MVRDHNEVEIERQQSAMLNKGYDHNEINNPNVRDRFNATGESAERYRNSFSGSSNGSGGGCFPKGTKISTPSGSKDISEIKEGDLIYSKDMNSERMNPKHVLRVKNHKNSKIWKLRFKEGGFIRTTAVHSFYVGGMWKKASRLMAGETVAYIDSHGKMGVKTISSSYEAKDVENVYNLIIEDDFNFIADGGLAHSFSYFRNLRMLLWRVRSKILKINHGALEYA